MDTVATTPFEDLVLGSQFLPLLAKTSTLQEDSTNSPKNIGIFQCRQCGATFLQVKEALIHYKYHVFESHKNYFSVVVGTLCPQVNCIFSKESKKPSIHFHCTYCSFAACEILDLPLHMEKGHLSFYKEVSLVLDKNDIQLNKVFRCGECDLHIQGTVSIVQHIISHDIKTNTSTNMENFNSTIPNGKSPYSYNGNTANEEQDTMNSTDNINHDLKTEPVKQNSKDMDTTVNAKILFPLLLNYMKDNEEHMQVEINPMDLLSTLMEEDQRSDFPLFPTQHFLLGHKYEKGNTPTSEDVDHINDKQSLAEPQPTPEILLNGFTEPYIEQSAGVFQCTQCKEAFKYQYLLAAHRKKVHQGHVLTPFKCHICNNEFALLNDLKRHTFTHSTDLAHFCQVCGHAFTDASSLKSHITEHSKTSSRSSASKEPVDQSLQEKPSKCDNCSEEFPSKSELTRHIVKYQGTCNPDKKEVLQCATCGVTLSSLDELKEHRRMDHPDEKPGLSKKGFQCDYCGKTFSCRSNLRDHLVVHTGEKPYPCDICGKAFSFVHNMKTHRLTHNEGRNEVCPYCDKAYKSKISLYYHMKKGNCRGLSTKEVPEGFQRCTECLQMFASEDRYQLHKSKGHCQMSYRCMHCGIRCSSQEKLDKHLEKGVCLKPPENPSRLKSKRRRSSSRKNSNQEDTDETCCERCNCDKDCCCTFSCTMCGKRIFSISAFNTHRRKTCPSLKQRRERIKAAQMEKERKRNEDENKYLDNEILKSLSNSQMDESFIKEIKENSPCVDEYERSPKENKTKEVKKLFLTKVDKTLNGIKESKMSLISD